MQLVEALTYLNPESTADWTQAGLPNIHAVHRIMGIKPGDEGSRITREMIDAVAPHFNRANPVLPEDAQPATETSSQSQAVPPSLPSPGADSTPSVPYHPSDYPSITQVSHEPEVNAEPQVAEPPNVTSVPPENLEDMSVDEQMAFWHKRQEDINDAISTCAHTLKMKQDELDILTANLQAVQRRINQLAGPNGEAMYNIRQYLEQAKKSAEEKGERLKRAREMNPDMDARSPLDRALSERNSRYNRKPAPNMS